MEAGFGVVVLALEAQGLGDLLDVQAGEVAVGVVVQVAITVQHRAVTLDAAGLAAAQQVPAGSWAKDSGSSPFKANKRFAKSPLIYFFSNFKERSRTFCYFSLFVIVS